MKFEKAALPNTYIELEKLLASGDAESVAYSCDLIVADFELESRAWFIGSKAYQELNKPNEARLNIETALKIEPFNVDFLFQLFNVYIQAGIYFEIAPAINRAFGNLSAEAKVSMIGYIEKAIETELIHRNQLTVEVATAVLKHRNRAE